MISQKVSTASSVEFRNYMSVLNHFVPGFVLVNFYNAGYSKIQHDKQYPKHKCSLSQVTQMFEKSRSQLKLERAEW